MVLTRSKLAKKRTRACMSRYCHPQGLRSIVLLIMCMQSSALQRHVWFRVMLKPKQNTDAHASIAIMPAAVPMWIAADEPGSKGWAESNAVTDVSLKASRCCNARQHVKSINYFSKLCLPEGKVQKDANVYAHPCNSYVICLPTRNSDRWV